MVKQFTYKIYRKPKNQHLDRLVNLHALLYNFCMARHQRYYRLTGKHLNQFRLMKHLTKLKSIEGFEWLNDLPSQSAQDVVQRIEKGYGLFFTENKRGNKRIRPPSFKKLRKYKSFTLKQAGWKLVADNRIRIVDRVYKFALSRPMAGEIKTVTVKRDSVGDFWVHFACEVDDKPTLAATGNTAGMDFGLKTFLTLDDGNEIDSPEFFKANAKAIQKANRAVSHKQRGSKSRCQAVKALARLHRKTERQRNDWQWKIARSLVAQYDTIWIEDLNLRGMKARWGRKVSDLAFSSFVQKLDDLAASNDKTVCKRDQYFPSSQTHFECGYVNHALTLADREWVCPQCGEVVQRDINAARMLKHGRAMSWSKDHL
ncbi:MAG: transposase [Chloroflexi bacterium]|nr:transposase [Chloroflexota bacterium]